MWSPPDKDAFPSPEEKKHAKYVIATLEDAIKDALELIERTRLRVAEMERDLEERKYWIAPIRKVPTEILADILLFASEMDDMAPVMFTAISRLWRNIILATPKAWSFIDLKRHYDMHCRHREHYDDFSDHQSTYFERSEPRPLHIFFPDQSRFLLKHSNVIIKKLAHRIQCLTIPVDVLNDTQNAPECQKFPHLQTLTLANEARGRRSLDTSFITTSRFPALQTLRWPNCSPWNSSSPIISSRSFPPLQHLSFDIGDSSSSSMEILRSCAATLKTLHISCDVWTTPSIRITFPLLQYLIVRRRFPIRGRPPLVKAVTPVLTSLEVISGDSSIPAFFEIDMQKITHMRWDTFKIPPVCTQLQVLQIAVDPDFVGRYADSATRLKNIAGAYPSLERIELSNEMKGRLGIRSMQQKVEECLGEEWIKPKLLWKRRLEGDFPGYVATTCGKDMPCHEW